MQIYISKNNQKLGPFEVSKVLELLRDGALLPSDYGIKYGQQNWQKLEVLFPNIKPAINSPKAPMAPAVQSMAQTNSSGLKFGLIGCGGLFLLGFIGLIGFLSFSGQKTSTSTNNVNSNTVAVNATPIPSPTVDYVKKAEMKKELEKKTNDLFKLSPPPKLQPKPIVKAKVLVIEKTNAEKEATPSIAPTYSVVDYGIKETDYAESLDEIQTLIQIKCSMGKIIGKYGPRMAYYVAYSNVCTVAVIDYKASVTLARKTFVNAKPPKTIPDNGYDFINDPPTEEIQKYLKGLARE
jgi:hypothetical protein